MNILRITNHKLLGAAAVCLTGMLTASLALAGPAGGRSHPDKELRIKDEQFKDLGTRLRAKATVRNLDRKGDKVRVRIAATAKAEVLCINPGGNVPPGAQPGKINVKLVGSATYLRKEISKKGELDIKVVARGLKEKDLEYLCPNPKWDAHLLDLAFTKANLIVRQGGRSAKLSCQFKPPTKDNKVYDGDCKPS